MKKLMSFAAVAAISLTAQANASVVDLNSGAFANGEILTNQIAGLTVSATSTGGGSANDFAFIFDTENAIGDGDLSAPFDDPSTPVDEGFRPGNVLAIIFCQDIFRGARNQLSYIVSWYGKNNSPLFDNCYP